MKKLIVALISVFFIAGVMVPRASGVSVADDSVPQDTALNVIAWFSKRDTVVYWIQESEWKIQPGDTVKRSGVSTQVMVTVIDSTAAGYKMDYTFMDVRGDSLADPELGGLQNRLVEYLGRKIVGTTIRFETDEYGEITKFDNLGQIKKQAKSLFRDAIKEMEKEPWVKELKGLGFNLRDYTKHVDADQLVEGYLEEIKLLFMCHGNVYEPGESTVHEDETDSQYANDTYTSATIDDDGCYHIMANVESKVPQADVKALVMGVVDEIDDEDLKANFDANFDAQVDTDCAVNSYLQIDFLPNGWPYEVVKQEATMIGGRGKVEQKRIYLDSYSFYNY